MAGKRLKKMAKKFLCNLTLEPNFFWSHLGLLRRASFDYCAKSLNIDVYALNLNLLQNPGILRFSISVKGTPPKTNDLWVNYQLIR